MVKVGGLAPEFHTMTVFCIRHHAICRGKFADNQFADNQSTHGKVEVAS